MNQALFFQRTGLVFALVFSFATASFAYDFNTYNTRITQVVTDNKDFPDEVVNFVVNQQTDELVGLNTDHAPKLIKMTSLRDEDGYVIKRKWSVPIVKAKIDSQFHLRNGGHISLNFRMNTMGTKWKNFDLIAKPTNSGWALFNGQALVQKIRITFEGQTTPKNITLE